MQTSYQVLRMQVPSQELRRARDAIGTSVACRLESSVGGGLENGMEFAANNFFTIISIFPNHFA